MGMRINDLSRRDLGLLAGSSLVSARSTSQPGTNVLTAKEVVERVRQHLGVPWQEQTVDLFKAGNPDTRVKGICTTVMATMDVLKLSAGSGKNLVITHEPTFWNHLDETKDFATDPICLRSRSSSAPMISWSGVSMIIGIVANWTAS